jgi:SAM-dependent methyltransferase
MDQKLINTQIEERIIQVLQHLGVEKAHFAARMTQDWAGLATSYPEVISSLTLVCQTSIDPDPLQNLAARLLVVVPDQSPRIDDFRRTLTLLPEATQVNLPDCAGMLWDDIIVESTDEIGHSMLAFMDRMDHQQTTSPATNDGAVGEVAGISYKVQGSGPPLVLLPLGLAPSQWRPLIPKLSEYYCTISLGGPELGIIPVLEERGRSPGYLGLLRNVMDEVQLGAGQRVLDVGCGSGVIDRWLARQTGGKNQIVGIDINDYLLKEAVALAKKEDLDGTIDFREGIAEDLPFADGDFDVTISSTVMEEVDADKMLAEMIRVTKPGGRVGVIVRATDIPFLVNIPLRAELKTKCENLGQIDEGKGCASVSLYQRFHRSTLTDVKMMPQLAVFDNPDGVVEKFLQGFLPSRLSPEEMAEWRNAVVEAADRNTFFISWPHHCAVGTKPG